MGSDENTWEFLAKTMIEQILERNENGNIYPLTTLEIKILNDFKDLMGDEEGEPEDSPENPEKSDTPQTPSKKDAGNKSKNESYHALDSKDLA